MTRKRTGWLALVLALSMILTACSSSKPAAPAAQPAAPAAQPAAPAKPAGPKTLTVGFWSSPDSLSPITNKTTYGSTVYSVLYPSLYVMNDKLEFEPRLADSVDINATQDQFTFHLKKNAKWSDGTPITANDVAYTFQVIAHPDTPTSRRNLIDTIKGLDANGVSETKDFNVSGIKVVDANTIQFTTKAPVDKDAFMEKAAANIFIMPKSVLEPAVQKDLKGLDKADHVLNPKVFGGSFRLVKFVPDQYLELEPNPDYFMGKPKLDKLFFKIVTQASFAASLQAGEIDVAAGSGIGEVPITDWEKVSTLANMVPVTYASPSYQYLDFNCAIPEFANPKIREAFAHAINRPLIVQRLLKGQAAVVNTPVYSVGKYYRKDLDSKLNYDPALAKKMLQENGWDFSKKITLLTPTGNKVREDSADIIQANLKEIGVQVDIEKVEFAARQARSKEGKFQISLVGFSTTFDPDFSSQVQTGATFNERKYSNKEMDDLMAKGKLAVKFEDKKAIYDRAQEIFVQDVPYLTLYAVKALAVVNKRVIAAKPGPNGLVWNSHLWDVQ